MNTKEEKWIMGVSIPLPIACKAIALPFELITQRSVSLTFSLQVARDNCLSLLSYHSAEMATCPKCFLNGCYPCEEFANQSISDPLLIGCEDASSSALCDDHD